MTKFSRLALGAALLSLPFVSPANAIVWPSIGADTLGPAIIITIGPGAVQTITNGPGAGQGPYDLVEDTYIGVVNNSGASISQVSLSAPSNIGIFGFDGDGIGAGTGAGNATYPAGCAAGGGGACGTANSNDSLSGGYGGPIGFFSNILLGDGSSNRTTLAFSTSLAIWQTEALRGFPSKSRCRCVVVIFVSLRHFPEPFRSSPPVLAHWDCLACAEGGEPSLSDAPV